MTTRKINFTFNKLDLDLIKYYCGHFTGIEKAVKFLKEFNLKINHLVTEEYCEISVFDFDYTHYNLDPNKKIEKYIPQKNVNEFESILKNLYIKYSIDNEYFTYNRGFNGDQMLLRGSFERFYNYEIRKGMFIYDLVDLDFKDEEMKKNFLFNMLMFSMKHFDLKKTKTIDYDNFCFNLGEGISKQCLDTNFNYKNSTLEYLIQLSDIDFFDPKNILKIKLFKKYFNLDLDNFNLINHINDHLLYECFVQHKSLVLEKFSKKVDLLHLKTLLEKNLKDKYFYISKKIIEYLVLEKRLDTKSNKLSTQLDIIIDNNNESDLFNFNLPSFAKKSKKFVKHRINKKELFNYLKSLDKLRIKPDAKTFDILFPAKMEELSKFFREYDEIKNFMKFLRYCCDFSDKNWFNYQPIESPVLYHFHFKDLEFIARIFYIRKLVFNSMLFRTIILLHVSNFYLRETDKVSFPYYVKITKPRSKI